MKRLLFFILGFLILTSACKTVSAPGVPGSVGMITTAVTETTKAARPISDEEEYYVGRAVAARILGTYPVLENRMLNGYINYIGQTVALNSDKPMTFGGYHFAVLNTDEPNAFACPGGLIFVTRGMIATARNEDELAAVLAHEIAHISHRDGISSIQQSRWTSALTIIGAQAAKQYGPAELSQLVNIFEGSIDDVFKTLVVNGYGREQELSADEISISYLMRAGYNPAALRDFLVNLSARGRSTTGGIMKTHPGTDGRIEAVARKLPPTQSDPAQVRLRAARFRAAFSP